MKITDRNDSRPIDPETGNLIGPLAQPGFYPGFHTLSQANFWDAKTREVILERVQTVPPIRFFTSEQAALLGAVCDRMLPQDDRDETHRIPIVPQIDRRLFDNSHDGYRYDDMPPDREAYVLALQGINAMAHALYGCAFVMLEARAAEELLGSLHDGNPQAAHEIWDRVPCHRFWLLLLTDCAEAYYSHPWAWDEIGFGGPAYPRAYVRLEHGEPESWEVRERRYPWAAPPASISDRTELVAGRIEHYGSPGS